LLGKRTEAKRRKVVKFGKGGKEKGEGGGDKGEDRAIHRA
jgi:hypothetical protein